MPTSRHQEGRRWGRANWGVPLPDEPSFSFPEVLYYPISFRPEFSRMAASSCKSLRMIVFSPLGWISSCPKENKEICEKMREIMDLVVSSVSLNIYLHYIFTERNSINSSLNLSHLQKALRGGACFYSRGKSLSLGGGISSIRKHLIKATFTQEGLWFGKQHHMAEKTLTFRSCPRPALRPSAGCSSLLSPCFCTCSVRLLTPASWVVKALREASSQSVRSP